MIQRTIKVRPTLDSLRKEMETNARGYNKYLTPGYMRKLPLEGLLCFTHPIDRPAFARRIEGRR